MQAWTARLVDGYARATCTRKWRFGRCEHHPKRLLCTTPFREPVHPNEGRPTPDRQYISIQPRVLSKAGVALPLTAFSIAQLE